MHVSRVGPTVQFACHTRALACCQQEKTLDEISSHQRCLETSKCAESLLRVIHLTDTTQATAASWEHRGRVSRTCSGSQHKREELHPYSSGQDKADWQLRHHICGR